MNSEELWTLALDWSKRHTLLKNELKDFSGSFQEKIALQNDADYAWKKFCYYSNRMKQIQKKGI